MRQRASTLPRRRGVVHRLLVQEAVGHGADVHPPRREPQALGHQPAVGLALGVRGAVGQEDRQGVLGPHGAGRQGRGQGRVDAPREAQQGALEAGAGDLLAQEADQHVAHQLRLDVELVDLAVARAHSPSSAASSSGRGPGVGPGRGRGSPDARRAAGGWPPGRGAAPWRSTAPRGWPGSRASSWARRSPSGPRTQDPPAEADAVLPADPRGVQHVAAVEEGRRGQERVPGPLAGQTLGPARRLHAARRRGGHDHHRIGVVEEVGVGAWGCARRPHRSGVRSGRACSRSW